MNDLVYTDASYTEVGVIQRYTLDMAFGADENDFELKTGADMLLQPGALVYVEGTEWGGIVDSVQVDETGDVPEVTHRGRTWHGILAGKVVCPDSGASHYTYDCDANALLAAIIERCGLGAVFEAPSTEAGAISGRFDRYCDAYSGLKKALAANGLRLGIERVPAGKTLLSAVPVRDYSEEMYSDQMAMDVTLDYRPVNHLVCLGSGELAAREVVHLYADVEGNVSTEQSIFGADERTEVYDYSGSDSLAEDGAKKLSEMQGSGSAIDLDLPDGGGYCIGDTIGCTSVTTGIAVTATVNKIIVKVGEDLVPIVSYEVGSLTADAKDY